MTVSATLERISLLLLALVVFLRPLVPESFETDPSAFARALGVVSDPSPLTSLAFDLVILIAAAVWLPARALGARRHGPRTGLGVGTAVVAVAAAMSCLACGQKRLAISASIDWLCGPILAMVLVGLIRTNRCRSLIISGILASACVQAAQCVDQHFFSFEDTWQQYLSIKDELWSAQGVPLDSPRVALFEGRMRARESSGFLPHSNITGSYLILCGFAGVGAVWAGWKRSRPGAGRLFGTGGALLVGCVFGSVILTKSLGAMLAGVAGIGLWILLWRGGSWIARHRLKAWVIGWLAVLLGLGAVAGHGLYHGSLPGQSLDFRWQYWRASARMIADHPLTGVGRENFGRHYLRYKSIEASEEVTTPHNLFVQAAADWGLPGLAGILAMMLGVSHALTRPTCTTGKATRQEPALQYRAREKAALPQRDADPQNAASGSDNPLGTHLLVSAGMLAVVVALLRVPLLGTTNAPFIYYTTVTTAFIWFVAFFVFTALASGRSLTVAVLNGSGGGAMTSGDVAAPRKLKLAAQPKARGGDETIGTFAVQGAVVGVFAFMLYEMINFALFVPAGATTFFALLALCLADRQPSRASPDSLSKASPHPPSARRRRLSFTVSALAVGVFVWQGLLPVARSTRLIRQAREAAVAPIASSLVQHPAHGLFLRAAAADPLDPTPPLDRARWLMSATQQPAVREEAYRLAVDALDAAMARDPVNVKYPRLLVQLYTRWAEDSPDVGHFMAAVWAARRALALYPRDPAGLATLAECQERAASATGSKELLSAAYDSYAKALTLDDARPAWERIRRFPERKRKHIEDRMTAIGLQLGQ